MSQPFDPYHRWLGIPPADQPPHHYRLLGLEPFEDNPDVIERAADRQTAHLRTFRTGPHAAVCQRLLDEVAAARLCLIKPEKKAPYDAFLRSRQAVAARPAQPAAKAAPPPLPVAPTQAGAAPVALEQPSELSEVEPASVPKTAASSRRRWLAAGAGVLAVALVLGIVWLIALMAWPSAPAGRPGAPPTVLAFDWPESQRQGATLEINGVPRAVPATGPVEFPCEPGEVRVVAALPGFERVEQAVAVASGGRTVFAPLWRESPPPEPAAVPADDSALDEEEFWHRLLAAMSEEEDVQPGPSPPPKAPAATPAATAKASAGAADSKGPPTPPAAPPEGSTAMLPGVGPGAASPPGPELPPKRPEFPPEPFKTDPQIDALVADAWAVVRRGDVDKGRERLLLAAKVNRQDLRVPFSLGLLDALLVPDWPSAEKHFQQCVQEQPGHVASLNNLALVRMRVNKENLAVKHWQAALAEGLAAPEIVQNLGRLQYLVQKERLSLKPAIQKALEALYADARGKSTASFQPSVGFEYMGLYGGRNPDFGWIEPAGYEDQWCVVCAARGKMKCPERDCVRGTVTRMASKAVAINPLTKTPIYQSSPIRVPCPTCRGVGWMNCIHCRNGKDKDLGKGKDKALP